MDKILLLKENMLVIPLGDLIRDKVCDFLSRNEEAVKSVEFFDINLSSVEILEKNIIDKIESEIKKYEINPKKIRLEITETAASELASSLVSLMQNIRRIGVNYLMDDFGTGYANFDFISTLNFEMIKIDRSMLLAAEKNEKNKAILKGMIEIVHNMKAKCVVEGAETQEQVDFLKALKADYIQGFYFSKPLPEKEFLEFIKTKNAI